MICEGVSRRCIWEDWLSKDFEGGIGEGNWRMEGFFRAFAIKYIQCLFIYRLVQFLHLSKHSLESILSIIFTSALSKNLSY